MEHIGCVILSGVYPALDILGVLPGVCHQDTDFAVSYLAAGYVYTRAGRRDDAFGRYYVEDGGIRTDSLAVADCTGWRGRLWTASYGLMCHRYCVCFYY